MNYYFAYNNNLLLFSLEVVIVGGKNKNLCNMNEDGCCWRRRKDATNDMYIVSDHRQPATTQWKWWLAYQFRSFFIAEKKISTLASRDSKRIFFWLMKLFYNLPYILMRVYARFFDNFKEFKLYCERWIIKIQGIIVGNLILRPQHRLWAFNQWFFS